MESSGKYQLYFGNLRLDFLIMCWIILFAITCKQNNLRPKQSVPITDKPRSHLFSERPGI